MVWDAECLSAMSSSSASWIACERIGRATRAEAVVMIFGSLLYAARRRSYLCVGDGEGEV